MQIRKVFRYFTVIAMMLSIFVIPIRAEESLEVQSIVANTKIGDGQREVLSFEITVNEASSIPKDLQASDFDIIHNVGTTVLDVKTGEFLKAHEDDGITLNVTGNVIKMEVKPFDFTGMYYWTDDMNMAKKPWQVIYRSDTESPLSFDANKMTKVKTQILDDAIKDSYTYAGKTRQYALYMPKDVNGPVPLVVWNHGGGEYKGDLENALSANKGLVGWVEAGYKTAVLVVKMDVVNHGVVGDYPPGAGVTDDIKMQIDQNNALQASLIKKLISDGKVDENRVYMTGPSSGGGATIRFLMQNPKMIAGAIPMCAADPFVPIIDSKEDDKTLTQKVIDTFKGQVYDWDENSQKMISKDIDTEALLNVPVSFTHAENDATCPSRISKIVYAAMEKLGDKNNQLFIFSDEQMAEYGISNGLDNGLLHWSWVRVLNDNSENSPMHWLFNQGEKSNNTTAIVVGGVVIVLLIGTFIFIKKKKVS